MVVSVAWCSTFFPLFFFFFFFVICVINFTRSLTWMNLLLEEYFKDFSCSDDDDKFDGDDDIKEMIFLFLLAKMENMQSHPRRGSQPGCQ